MRKVFVFGSNLAGLHGAGSALHACRYWGAKQGQGKGYQGDSYAIPTKGRRMEILSLAEIAISVQLFLDFAKNRSDIEFHIVAIGCGLAGYKPEQIATMFTMRTSNCVLPTEFQRILHAA